MALLIGMYGHGRKIYAAVKFFLYTMIASMFMLAAILWLYAKTGSFDLRDHSERHSRRPWCQLRGAAPWLFLGFFIAFAVKVPLFPFHTWLPDAHVEAPTAGSVLLAGVLLKMGTYGMLRFNLGLFPEQSRRNAPWIMILALIGIIYGALVAMVQPNMKKVIAYSSVSHLGFVVLGIFSFTQAGLDGAMFVMLAHGVATGGLFMLAGILYDRKHTYEISRIRRTRHSHADICDFLSVHRAGFRRLASAERLRRRISGLSGAFQARPIYGILGATGVIWSACYLLWMYQRVFYGKVTHERTMRSLISTRERSRYARRRAALVMGVAPLLWLNTIDPAVAVAWLRSLKSQQDGGPMNSKQCR